MKRADAKMILLESAEYETLDEWIESGELSDSVVLGVCTACGGTTEVGPDQVSGYCEECELPKVMSALIVFGLI